MTAMDAAARAAFDDDAASLASLFEGHAARHPDRIAVVSGDSRLTYGELNQAANRIAHLLLARLGSGETTVALLFQPGTAIVAAILGVLKAGKIYVALDPSYPQPRTAYMLEDCQAPLLLTDTRHVALAHEVAQRGPEVVNCDEISPSTAVVNPDGSYSYTPNPDLKGYTNDHPFPPEIVVESPYLKTRIARLTGKLDSIAGKVSDKQLDEWRKQTLI